MISGCVSNASPDAHAFRVQSKLKVDKTIPDLGNASRVYYQGGQEVSKSELAT